MIRKLRIKFIAAAMCSLFFVLLFIISAVNIYNYKSIADTADITLSFLAQNNGMFPTSSVHPFIPGEPGNHKFSPEMPYETRFFSVTIASNGYVVTANTEHIAAVDRDIAAQYAVNVYEKGKASGFKDNYRYAADYSDGNIQIIFLDCTKELSTFKNFLFSSLTISILGLAAVFVSLMFLSARIIRPVAESHEKQKRFITDAGHELKTPLTVIDADAELLEMEFGENEWLRDIRNQTKRLAGLTNDLIYLSRMQEDGVGVKFIDFPVSDVVEEAAQSFSSVAVTQKKRILGDIQPFLSFTGDEKGIRRLVNILVDNALKYSPEESDIKLSLRRSGRHLVLSVSNVCVQAIKSDELPHLFDRFYRSDKSRNSATGGYGIGLSMASAIVEAHKGKISVQSAGGDSVIFTATLPMQNMAYPNSR